MCFGAKAKDPADEGGQPPRPVTIAAIQQAQQEQYQLQQQQHEHLPNNSMSYQWQQGDFAPPPGPPPPPPPAADWETAVPDTSLLPPPPAFFGGWRESPANNATEAESEAAERWCAVHPMSAPLAPDGGARAALAASSFTLVRPAEF